MNKRTSGIIRTFAKASLPWNATKPIYTPSLNYSESADESNDENILLIGNETIAQLYLDEFDRRWEEGHDCEPSEDS